MAFRSSSLRFVRVLTNELTASSRRCSSSLVSRQSSLAPLSNNSFVSTNESLRLRKFSTKPEEKEPAPPEEAAAEETTAEETAEAAPAEESKEAQLEKEIKDLKDSLLRSLAEQENTRRIASRDVASAKQFAITSFAKSLLDTSDNLSRALDAVPEELRHDHEKHPVLANLYEGISMTNEGLDKAFAKNGLKKFGAVGEKFDPNLHEALFEYPDPKGEAGCIGQVMKVGFMLNERVVRPAEVGVVKSV
jgi:molecular chaperone GrpE